MARRRRIITSCLLVSLMIFGPTVATAQFGGIVFDPKNYIQNLYSASRTLVQIRQQVTQLQNEARMLTGQARDLASLDFNAQAELLRILDEITQLNREAGSVAYEVSQTRQILSTEFPEDYSNLSQGEVTLKAESQWKMAREGYHAAMIMQSGLVESLTVDRQTLSELITESQSSTCLLYTSPSPRDRQKSRMPSSA